VILPSSLGMKLKEPAVNLNRFNLIKIDSAVYDQTWQTVWGEYSSIRDHHKELRLHLQQKDSPQILLNIVFRVFNKGVGFRYEFPQQQNFTHFILEEENSQFHLTGDHKVFWIPGDYDTNEFKYNTSKLSEVDASSGKFVLEIHAKTFFDKNAVQPPLMIKTGDGLYINLHEAALVNYSAMNLVIDKSSFTLNSHLVPDAVGNKAYLIAPVNTPWRTIIVSDKATDMIAANRMILNLNEPCKVENTFSSNHKNLSVYGGKCM
jgi:glucan 1,4-alpha-glucosidase